MQDANGVPRYIHSAVNAYNNATKKVYRSFSLDTPEGALQEVPVFDIPAKGGPIDIWSLEADDGRPKGAGHAPQKSQEEYDQETINYLLNQLTAKQQGAAIAVATAALMHKTPEEKQNLLKKAEETPGAEDVAKLIQGVIDSQDVPAGIPGGPQPLGKPSQQARVSSRVFEAGEDFDPEWAKKTKARALAQGSRHEAGEAEEEQKGGRRHVSSTFPRRGKSSEEEGTKEIFNKVSLGAVSSEFINGLSDGQLVALLEYARDKDLGVAAFASGVIAQRERMQVFAAPRGGAGEERHASAKGRRSWDVIEESDVAAVERLRKSLQEMLERYNQSLSIITEGYRGREIKRFNEAMRNAIQYVNFIGNFIKERNAFEQMLEREKEVLQGAFDRLTANETEALRIVFTQHHSRDLSQAIKTAENLYPISKDISKAQDALDKLYQKHRDDGKAKWLSAQLNNYRENRGLPRIAEVPAVAAHPAPAPAPAPVVGGGGGAAPASLVDRIKRVIHDPRFVAGAISIGTIALIITWYKLAGRSPRVGASRR
jgi:hypothetical protein